MGKGEGNLKENKYIEPVDITHSPTALYMISIL